MNDKPIATPSDSNNQEDQAQRKPYSKPEVVYLQPLEAMADICQRPLGKVIPEGLECITFQQS